MTTTGPEQSETGSTASSATANRVRLSYRPLERESASPNGDGRSDGDGSGFVADHLVHQRVQERPFRTYLRRVHDGPVSAGDEWAEFVNCGCGTTTDVVLRVEAVEGGTRLGDRTAIDLAPCSGPDPER